MRKTALITGASRGIGAAIAEEFARNGYHLSLCCMRSGESLQKLADRIHLQYAAEVLTFIGDVGEESFVNEMCKDTLSDFGHVDVLINNAGISHIGLLTDLDMTGWNRILSANLTSAYLTSRCLIPSMIARGSGRILNISSVWGSSGASCEAAYSASKGGLNALTKSLGKELAPSHIPVNAIACGLIDTEMNAHLSSEEMNALTDDIPAGRMGRPEEVAQLAYLLAEAPEYLTAQTITIDGGWI